MNMKPKTLKQLWAELGGIQYAINGMNWERSRCGFKDAALEARHAEYTKAYSAKVAEITAASDAVKAKREADAAKRGVWVKAV